MSGPGPTVPRTISEQAYQAALFPVTLADLRSEVLYRLGEVPASGDSNQRYWTDAEINRYLKEGYELLCLRTGILWERAYIEDQTGVGVCRLPNNLYEIERATWNYRILSGVASVDIERFDSRYQITQGEVYAYTLDKDGLRNFRKIRVPARDADQFSVSDAGGVARGFLGDPLYGIPRVLTDVVGGSESYTGSYGIPRRVPGYDAIGGISGVGSYPYGVPRRFIKDYFNTKVEYRRRPYPVVADTDRFELPTRFLKWVRFYAQWRALEREGPGQNLKLAAHYQERWGVGIKRILATRESIKANRLGRFGGAAQPRNGPPRPSLPWPYGKRVRLR